MYSCYGMTYQHPNYKRLNFDEKAANPTNTCHSFIFLVGLNLPGADLNSEGRPEGQNTWMYSVIQRPGTQRHWIPASPGVTLGGSAAASMKIFTHSILGKRQLFWLMNSSSLVWEACYSRCG